MKIIKINNLSVLSAIIAFLFSFSSGLKSQNSTQHVIKVDATNITGTIGHPWNAMLGGLTHSLTPQGNRLLQWMIDTYSQPFYRVCWAVTQSGTGIDDYGATNVYQMDKNGHPFYDFTLFDQIFDVIISKKFIPVLEFGFMPDSLSSAPAEVFKQKGKTEQYPPKDYDKWYDLVYNIMKHCVERYGKEEVKGWKCEVWSEPDIHWMGTEQEYFKLYDYTAAAVKSVIPEVKIGGNAVTHSRTKGISFLTNFIEHCLRGTNYRTHSTGTPLEFISFHLKGTSFDIKKIGNFTSGIIPENIPKFSPSLDFLMESARFEMEKITAIPGTKGIPVYITECDIDIGLTISMYENPNVEYRNTEYYPAFQCALAKEMLDLSSKFPSNPVEFFAIDGFFYPGYRIFEGQRAVFTAGEIQKPIFNAFILLGKLGTERLKFESSMGKYVSGLATLKDSNIQIMVYNYNQDVNDRENRKVELSVIFPSSKSYRLSHYRIDENHSNAYTVWKSLGRPLTPDESQMSQIKAKQGLELYEPVKNIKPSDNKITIPLEMPHHSVSLLVFEPLK